MGINEELKDIKILQDMLNKLNNPQGVEDYNKIIEDIEKIQSNDYSNINYNTTYFTNDSNNEDPTYAKEGDSGFDLRAFINEPVTLKPLERKLIPTGLKFQLPTNTELQVRPRSGMAYKHGISVLNTPGTVDEGYRGDVGIIAINLSNETYTIQPGERIAQGVIMNVLGSNLSKLVKKEELNETERGSTGFGSTGKN
tara:strand:- start:1224 stop:1814 length:591 start_codon:yes stop_codon:yes gene_type:complete